MADTVTTGAPSAIASFTAAMEAQRERLLPCVHCGFCLPACPTYTRLGDEADSPRGRLHLMGAVVEGRMDPSSEAFRTHIDRCLGCRACEPVCPSGVEYGTLLELARETAARARPIDRLTRVLLTVMGSRGLRAVAFGPARLLRLSGVARVLARVLPSGGVLQTVKYGMAMLAASAPFARRRIVRTATTRGPEPAPSDSGSVAMLSGCVQSGLYGHVNSATRRVLKANGFSIVAAAGQGCCGALHAHGGSLDEARELARANIDAFEASGADTIVVNTAGCGATMKHYGTLLEADPDYAERAASLAAKTRDATEVLADVGPRRGAPLEARVAFDHPCHLLHGQGVREAPLDTLAAIPSLDVVEIERADECCGGAGIYGITHPELGGEIGADKVASVRAAEALVACTPNPGCMMQIGAGLRMEGASEGVVHPVELLDESYRRAGYYRR